MNKLRLLHSWMFTFLVLAACTPTPDFYDTEGKRVDLETFQSEYLLINYWADWCVPCIAEIPELNILAHEHGDRLAVIGVNFDGLPVEQLKAQMQRLGIEYPVLTVDPAARLQIETPQVLPATYLMGTNRKLIRVLVGPQTVDSILQVLDSQ